MAKEKFPVTAAVRALRDHDVAFTHHPYEYEERGGTAVSTEDILRVAHVSMRHRIILNFEGEAQQIKVDTLIDDVIKQVRTPAQQAA